MLRLSFLYGCLLLCNSWLAFSAIIADSSGTCTLSSVGSNGDDSPNVEAAFKSPACNTVVIPLHTTLNVATRLNTTGLANKRINLQGTLRFLPDISYWTGNAFFFDFQNSSTFWLLGGNDIIVDGGGTGILDGIGQPWYDAFNTNATLARPIILTIFQGTNVIVQNLQMLNSPMWFNFINEGHNVTFANINISASSNVSTSAAHNTDGWDIYRSDQVVLRDSVINNDDDCVSFKPNSTNVLVENLDCTGSHGISVGSLGQFPGVFDIVENVVAQNIRMTNAQNGARIKCWAGSNVGSGSVKNVTFVDFIETNVDNPLIIDQCYMTSASQCTAFPSNTFITDVIFQNISGTSSGAEKSTVASLNCSPNNRCSGLIVNDINLSPPAKFAPAKFSCQNVVLQGNSMSLFPNCTVT
ncbi:glycoside hydrolase family 28 protein [Gautieria morchelliformis]|nr:glycoside hydrolase family 28 protein [Gautieria morchelliformis]